MLRELNKDSSLKLDKLDKLTEFNGRTLDDLPTPVQLQFFKRSLRVTALSDKSDPDVRFETFQRLNRGGVALTEQEVRSCVFRGPFNDLLQELAASDVFCSIVKLQKSHEDDGTKEELVLKFFAYLDDSASFTGQVTKFLNDYMKNNRDPPDIQKRKQLFNDVANRLSGILGGRPFLRSGYSLTPQNQLEAAMVAVGKLIRGRRKISMPAKKWLEDAELVKHSTKGTNTKKALEGRISRVIELLS